MTTRERLLSTARQVLLGGGLEGTSVRSLTEAAGANIAAVSYYYGSRKGLVREVLRRAASSLSQSWTEAADAKGASGGALDGFVGALAADPTRCALVGRALSSTTSGFRNLVSAELADGLEALTGALLREHPGRPRSEVHAALLFGLAAALLWLPEPEILGRLGAGRYRQMTRAEIASAVAELIAARLSSPMAG